MPRGVDRFVRPMVLAVYLLVANLSAHAATISDDFNANHDYQIGSTTGTV